MSYGHNPHENNLAEQGMDLVSQIEGKLTELLAAIIKDSKEDFLKGGYTLEADIERSYAKSTYESEVYVLLRHKGEVVELYPIQVALALQDEEPVVFVDTDRLVSLEKEVKTELGRWVKKYLTA